MMRMVACEQRRDPKDMSLHRPGARLLRPATACTALAFYALWIRPQMLTWGRDSRRDHLVNQRGKGLRDMGPRPLPPYPDSR